jgi:DNA-binding PadR family transcriptional regulator
MRNENDHEDPGEHGHDHGHGHGHHGPPTWVLDAQPRWARRMAGGRGRRGAPEGMFGPPWGRFPPGGFGGPFGRGRGGRGRRTGRGDVRTAILALLAESPMHGYQIIQELAERTEGAWRASPGSVYPTLQNLEDIGLVLAEKAHGKRIYQLTDKGREAADAAGDGPKPWEEIADEVDHGMTALRNELASVAAAAVQVAQAGSDDQIAQAKRILSEAKRKLYLLLAEAGDETDDPSAEKS